jgi:SanA protein
MPRYLRKRRWSLLGRILAGVALVVFLLVILVLTTSLVVSRGGRSRIAASAEDAPKAKVAIVLGARVLPSGNPSDMLADRLDTGVALYKAGKVQKLLLSGDHGQTTYDEVNAMRKYCLARGVADQDIFMDHAGFDTYDTMYRARDVFQVTDCLVVTQSFHLPRAVYTARALGLDATGVSADLHSYPNEWRFASREWPARVKAFFQLHVLHSQPKYLGPVIPIDGDGRATRG